MYASHFHNGNWHFWRPGLNKNDVITKRERKEEEKTHLSNSGGVRIRPSHRASKVKILPRHITMRWEGHGPSLSTTQRPHCIYLLPYITHKRPGIVVRVIAKPHKASSLLTGLLLRVGKTRISPKVVSIFKRRNLHRLLVFRYKGTVCYLELYSFVARANSTRNLTDTCLSNSVPEISSVSGYDASPPTLLLCTKFFNTINNTRIII